MKSNLIYIWMKFIKEIDLFKSRQTKVWIKSSIRLKVLAWPLLWSLWIAVTLVSGDDIRLIIVKWPLEVGTDQFMKCWSRHSIVIEFLNKSVYHVFLTSFKDFIYLSMAFVCLLLTRFGLIVEPNDKYVIQFDLFSSFPLSIPKVIFLKQMKYGFKISFFIKFSWWIF